MSDFKKQTKDEIIKDLQEQLCLIRGAIEELAIGVGPAHYVHHFTVFDPLTGRQTAVPWEWAIPPFELVRQKMNDMGDYGTRTNRKAHDADLLRMDLEEAQKDSRRLNLINRRDLDIGFEEGDPDVGVPSAFFVAKTERDEKGRLVRKVIGVDPDLRTALDQAAQEWDPKPVEDQEDVTIASTK